MWVIINAVQLILLFLWLVWPVSFVIPFFSKKIIYIVARRVWSTGTLLLAGIWVRVEGKENLNANENYVFIANHRAYIDIPAMFVATQRDLRFIAKQELRKVPFIGYAIKRMDMIYLQRKDASSAYGSYSLAIEKVKAGADILIFPEGTRSRTEKIQPFRKGAVQVAANAGVKLVPVAIKNAGKLWSMNNMRFRPGYIKVKIGEPYTIESAESNVLKQEIKKAQEIVEKMHNEL